MKHSVMRLLTEIVQKRSALSKLQEGERVVRREEEEEEKGKREKEGGRRK